MSYAIVQKIKTIRNERGFSQEEVADKLGMSRQRYIRIESNQVPITFKVIEELARILNVTPHDITKQSEEQQPLKVLFRENNMEAHEEVVSKIQTILEYMNAHERLYYKMKEGRKGGKA